MEMTIIDFIVVLAIIVLIIIILMVSVAGIIIAGKCIFKITEIITRAIDNFFDNL